MLGAVLSITSCTLNMNSRNKSVTGILKIFSLSFNMDNDPAMLNDFSLIFLNWTCTTGYHHFLVYIIENCRLLLFLVTPVYFVSSSLGMYMTVYFRNRPLVGRLMKLFFMDDAPIHDSGLARIYFVPHTFELLDHRFETIDDKDISSLTVYHVTTTLCQRTVKNK